MKRALTYIFAASLLGAQSFAQTAPAHAVGGGAPAPAAQEQCINVMAGFPSASQSARYQFFRLTQSLAKGATPEFRVAAKYYSSGKVTADTPVAKVIEGIANPVLRQAEPRLVIGQAAYLIDFAETCSGVISGQIKSLQAYDSDLKNAEFNAAIDQDALFLRQILSDALYSENAHENLLYGDAVKAYAKSLVTTRDHIEFSSFESDVSDLEALYMGDLDKRLARSNDLANSEMNNEALSSAVALSDDMSASHKKQEQQRSLQTLIQILNGY